MTAGGWTPGPWRARHPQGGSIYIEAPVSDFGEPARVLSLFELRPNWRDVIFRLDDDGKLFASISYDAWYQFPPETFKGTQEANARLIAAAPALYEALETVMRLSGSYVAEHPVIAKKARAALALARGDTPS